MAMTAMVHIFVVSQSSRSSPEGGIDTPSHREVVGVLGRTSHVAACPCRQILCAGRRLLHVPGVLVGRDVVVVVVGVVLASGWDSHSVFGLVLRLEVAAVVPPFG